jgi:hypothetical protein
MRLCNRCVELLCSLSERSFVPLHPPDTCVLELSEVTNVELRAYKQFAHIFHDQFALD